MERRKILWVGDGPDCPSGFGLATRRIVEYLDYRQKGEHEVTVLGINYQGDPKTVPYDVYACAPGGDAFGVGRLIWMCDVVKPDLIILQNDPWNFPAYFQRLKLIPEYANVPVVVAVAVDGLNCFGTAFNDAKAAIFWTKFAVREARAGGYTGPATVIPLGVDTEVYRPMDRYEARLHRGFPRDLDDAFIVGNVNRNQPRKRMDLTVKYFAEWVKRYNHKDAYLYLHVAPTGDKGINILNLAKYYGVLDHLSLYEPPVFYGISEQEMVLTYNTFDVCITTTQGEGFGLTTLEAMACGIPCIVPDWSALGDWAADAAWVVPCSSSMVGDPYVNVIGGVVDEEQFIVALESLYTNRELRLQHRALGLDLATASRYSWEAVGVQWHKEVNNVLAAQPVAVVA